MLIRCCKAIFNRTFHIQRRRFSYSSSTHNELNRWRRFETLLWQSYQQIAPQSTQIQNVFRKKGEVLKNDHIAFRTFQHSEMDLYALDTHLKKYWNFHPKADYHFPEKRLNATHFEHVSEDPAYPLIFVSELDTQLFNNKNRLIINDMLATIPREPQFSCLTNKYFLASGMPWNPLTIADYLSIQDESEYGAWLSAFGFIPNHFTVSANAIKSDDLQTIDRINNFLEANGFELNESGGKVKGHPKLGLVQSSTMAPYTSVQFKDGIKDIRGAYYEFARRYPITFKGFIANSADKIFESTDNA